MLQVLGALLVLAAYFATARRCERNPWAWLLIGQAAYWIPGVIWVSVYILFLRDAMLNATLSSDSQLLPFFLGTSAGLTGLFLSLLSASIVEVAFLRPVSLAVAVQAHQGISAARRDYIRPIRSGDHHNRGTALKVYTHRMCAAGFAAPQIIEQLESDGLTHDDAERCVGSATEALRKDRKTWITAPARDVLASPVCRAFGVLTFLAAASLIALTFPASLTAPLRPPLSHATRHDSSSTASGPGHSIEPDLEEPPARPTLTDMQYVIGSWPTHDSAEDRVIRLETIAAAPESLAELIRSEPRVEEILRIMETYGVQADETFLRMALREIMHDGRIATASTFEQSDLQGGDGIDGCITHIMRDSALAGVMTDVLVPHLQRQILLTRFHLDPQRMARTTERFGPLDWRHPNAQDLYWLRPEVSTDQVADVTSLSDALMRVERQADVLGELVMTGGVVQVNHSNDEMYCLVPDLRYAAPLIRALEESHRLLTLLETRAGRESVADTRMRVDQQHERLLRLLVVTCYLHDEVEAANTHFYRLRERHGGDRMREVKWQTSLPLDEYVLKGLTERRGMRSDSSATWHRAIAYALLDRGIREGLYVGKRSTFKRYAKLAAVMIARAASIEEDSGKHGGPSYELMLQASYIASMESRDIDMIFKARVWRNTPPQLQVMVYGRLRPHLEPLVNEYYNKGDIGSIHFETVFPAPPITHAADAVEPKLGGDGDLNDEEQEPIEAK